MRTIPRSLAVLTLLSLLVVGCDRSGLNSIGPGGRSSGAGGAGGQGGGQQGGISGGGGLPVGGTTQSSQGTGGCPAHSCPAIQCPEGGVANIIDCPACNDPCGCPCGCWTCGSGGAVSAGGTSGVSGSGGVVSSGSSGSCAGRPTPINHRPSAGQCPSQRGPGPSGQPYPYLSACAATGCSGPFGTTCASDSDCTAGANGRCFPDEGLVGPGGCSYDECFTDSDCGAKTPCLCRSSSMDNSANTCSIAGNCAVDSDCGPCGYCSPSPQVEPNQPTNVCWGSFPYYCHTAADLCINDTDCAQPDGGPPEPRPTHPCAYNPQNNRWECTNAICALP